MKLDLFELMASAGEAKPCGEMTGREKDRWARLFPIYQKLRDNGFRCDAAIQWLIGKGAIPKDDAKRAQNAFWQLAVRKKKQNASAEKSSSQVKGGGSPSPQAEA